MFEGTQLSLFEMLELESAEQQSTTSSLSETDEASKILSDVESLISKVNTEVEAFAKAKTEADETEEEEVVSTTSAPAPVSSPSTTSSKSKSKGSTKSSAASKTISSPAKPVIESVALVTEDWKIRYSGTTYYLNLLFEEEITDGKVAVTLEEIREKLVTTESCIELSPQRAYWEVDEPQKTLVLICKGQTKGGV